MSSTTMATGGMTTGNTTTAMGSTMPTTVGTTTTWGSRLTGGTTTATCGKTTTRRHDGNGRHDKGDGRHNDANTTRRSCFGNDNDGMIRYGAGLGCQKTRKRNILQVFRMSNL